MNKPLSHQILSLSLAAMLTAGLLSGLGGLADQQHRSAAMAMAAAKPSVAQKQRQADASGVNAQALAASSALAGQRS